MEMRIDEFASSTITLYIGGATTIPNAALRTRCRQRSFNLPKRLPRIEILQKTADVLEYVETVRQSADTERDALGFLPSHAYEEAARKGTLFVAVSDVTERQYAGHILFGNKFPHARIYQTFVSPPARGNGVGSMLVTSLVDFAESRGYLSVGAKVASDLDANKFYESLGFEILNVKAGGSSRGRVINIRGKQLDTPALFGYRQRVSGLPLAEPISAFTPVLTIDLNVFFDVAKNRPRATFGGIVMGASFNNLIRLTVTDEFAAELRRTSSGTHDPVLEFALQLPTLSSPMEGIPEVTLQRLSEIVFPARAASGSLTVQDRSDLKHLAIAAHHTVTAFVTAERALVDASQELEEQFGLRVVHVENLAALLMEIAKVRSPLDIGFADGDLRLSGMDARLSPSIDALSSALELSEDVRTSLTSKGMQSENRNALLTSLGDDIVCMASWKAHASFTRELDVLLLVDEEQASCEVAVDALLHQLSRIATASGPARIQLTIPNVCLNGQRIALRCGFLRCSDTSPKLSRFQRLSIGAPVPEASWESIRRAIQGMADMTFPSDFPLFTGADMRVNFEAKDSKEFAIDLFDLETTLSPTILLLAGRSGVLVPIKPIYADDLLGTAEQASLFPKRKAAVIHERTYFCSSRNVKQFERGTAAVFYESGKSNGRMAAIALARVRNAEVISKHKLSHNTIECGVLDEQDLIEITEGEQVTALTFDNVMKLKRPVPLSKLRELGCIDGANAVTSRTITATQLQQIVEEGQGTRE
jgi:GNAT superfamily N-acetyltransferase